MQAVITLGSPEYQAISKGLRKLILKDELLFQEFNDAQYAVNLSEHWEKWSDLLLVSGMNNKFALARSEEWREIAELAAHEEYSKYYWNTLLQDVNFG